MSWQSSARTDRGRARPYNEDAYLARPDVGLFVVADGMGGHAAGEVASAIATETIEDIVVARHEAGDDPAEVVAVAVREANRAIRRAAREDPDKAGMGTTATALAIGDDGYRIAHVGDSRAYLIREEALRRVTVDHTWVQQQVEQGTLNEFQAQRHPYSGVLTRALGTEEDVGVDVYEGATRPGDVFLLCSDGLTAVLLDDDIAELLVAPTGLDARCQALVDAANDGGGPDNITVVLVAIEG